MFDIHAFGVSAAWSPFMFLFVALVAVLYIVAVTTYRTDWFKASEPVPGKKIAATLIGLALFYLAHGSPLDLAAHIMFSAHMVTMAISYLMVPPLLLYGIPDWMYRAAFKHPGVQRWLHRITQPILTLVFFNMLFSLYHLPAVHDYIMTNYAVHTLYYIVLFIAALMMWWNVVAPVPEFDRLSDVKKMGYVFANGVLLTPACALIIFAPTALFATYTDPEVWAKAIGYCVPYGVDVILANFTGPADFAILSPKDDQQLGGVLMKTVQEITYGAILFYNFMRWYRKENPSNQIDPIDALPTLK